MRILSQDGKKKGDYSPPSTNFCNTVITRLLKLRFSFLAISSNFAFKFFGKNSKQK